MTDQIIRALDLIDAARTWGSQGEFGMASHALKLAEEILAD